MPRPSPADLPPGAGAGAPPAPQVDVGPERRWRDPRPPRWRVRTLQRRRALGRPALREDALRQRPAREAVCRRVPPDRQPEMEASFRGVDRVRAARHDVHRTYQPSRIVAFADDVPIGQGRGPIDGKPAAYVCRNRTCEAPLTSAEALRERFST